MNWDRTAQNAERAGGAVCLLTVAASAAFFAWDTHQTQIVARMAAYNAAATAYQASDTLAIVNRPCGTVVNGKLLPDGPICELDQAIHDVRKIATAAGAQVTQTGQLIVASTRTLDQAGASIRDTAATIQGTSQAATGSLTALQGDLAALQQPISASTALMARSTATVGDLDELLKRKAIGQILDHAAGIMDHTDEITWDFDQIADKETKAFLKPVPWYLWPVKQAGNLTDIAAAIARHTP